MTIPVGLWSLSLFPIPLRSSPEKDPVCVFPQFPLPFSLLFIHLPLSLSPSLDGFSLLLITVASSPLPFSLLASHLLHLHFSLLLYLLSSGLEPVILALTLNRDWDMPQLGLPEGWRVCSSDMSLFTSQPRFSPSPNLYISQTSWSVALLRLFAPSHLSPGIQVGPTRGCQGELSDSGAGGRLWGHSETCIREAARLRDSLGKDTDLLDRDVQSFLFMGSIFSLMPMEAGHNEASKKLWGHCGMKL